MAKKKLIPKKERNEKGTKDRKLPPELVRETAKKKLIPKKAHDEKVNIKDSKLPPELVKEMANKKAIPKKGHNQKRKPQQKVQQRGVVYVKHIPHGFYEEEMKKYFSQFGKVTNLRLSRSAKTGGSRGYAFVEFLSEDVAKIVADTMDGYLFFNKILKCSVLPKEQIHEGLFKHFRYPFPLRKEVVRTVHNRHRNANTEKKSAQRRLVALERTKARLRKMGVRCDFVPEVPSALLEPLESSTASLTDNSGFPLVVDSSDDSITIKTPVGARRVRKVKQEARKAVAATLVDVTPGRVTPSAKKSPATLLASLSSSSRRRRRPLASTPAALKATPTKTPTIQVEPSSPSKRKRATPAKSQTTPTKTPTIKAEPSSPSKRKRATPAKTKATPKKTPRINAEPIWNSKRKRATPART